jgi:hypothetical protein
MIFVTERYKKRTVELFDFGIGWIDDSDDRVFLEALRNECADRGLRFVFVDPNSIGSTTEEVRRGRLKISFFLDLASELNNPDDQFTRLVYLLKDFGTRVVADPDQAQFWADKSITHFRLLEAEVPVPATVVVRNWDPSRHLTIEEKEKLGLPFIMKPASGYGQRGVRIIRERMNLREIAEARLFDPGDNFLLQEYIEPVKLNNEPAWFRVFYLFGEVFVCWWNPVNGKYRQTTLREFGQHGLLPVVRITSEIGGIVGIEWFSCEVALKDRNGKFVVIDYMNDQCDTSSQSHRSAGVPDDLLRLIARRMAEKAWMHVRGKGRLYHRALWFPQLKEKDEDA